MLNEDIQKVSQELSDRIGAGQPQGLAARGNTEAEASRLIEQLARLRIIKHGGNVDRAIQSLNTPANVGKTQLADKSTNDEQDATAQTLAHTGQPSESPGGAPAGARYRRIRSHARGGLGEVSLARDEELHRKVALKEILPAHLADQNVRANFAAEARITGSLEHPGIVPIYGFGQYDDGRLYYAMRFIQGTSLKQGIERFHQTDWSGREDARKMELRSLLRRFVDLCNALGFAHSRGIVHRDVKPANVMLGQYGETMVVDWGLAVNLTGERDGAAIEKDPHDGNVGATISHKDGVVGTPAYMSPEQAGGQMADLGPTSDIYSLGATLYHLLCGEYPFKQQPLTKLLTEVRAGRFPPPRKMDGSIPRALEAICLKAMSLNPDERYESSLDMARDIEHWLADEPVTAYREKLLARVARWARRHRAWTQAAAMALLAVTIVSACAVVVVNRSLQRESAAHADSQRQRTRAEENFRQAQSAVDTYFTKVSEDKLLNQPRMESLRRELLMVAADYYRDFVKQHGDDPQLKTEAARALQRLAQIERLIGKSSAATTAMTEAERLFREGIREQPTLRKRLELAKLLIQKANANRDIGNGDEALQGYQEALTILQRAAADHGDRPELRLLQCSAKRGVGLVYYDRGDHKSARKHLEDTIAISQQAATDRPGDYVYQNQLPFTLRSLSLVQAAVGDLSQALETRRRELRLRERLAADFSDTDEPVLTLVEAQVNLGNLLKEMEQYDEAVQVLTNGLESVTELREKSPEIKNYQHRAAGVHINLSTVLDKRGEAAKGAEHLRQAIALLSPLVDVDPENTRYRQALGTTYNNLGQLLKNQKTKFAEAIRHLQSAMEIRRRLAAENRDVRKFQSEFADTLVSSSDLFLRTGRFANAAGALEKAQPILLRLMTEHAEVAEYRKKLSLCYFMMSNIWQVQSQFAKALPSAQQAVKTMRPLASRQPATPSWRNMFVGMLFQEGKHLTQLKQYDKAQQRYDEALPIAQRLVAEHKATISHYQRFAELYQGYGLVEEKQKRLDGAIEWYERAVGIHKQVTRKHSRNGQAVMWLATAYTYAGNARLAVGQGEQALGDFASAEKLFILLTKSNPKAVLILGQLGIVLQGQLKIKLKQGDRSPEAHTLADRTLATREKAFQLGGGAPIHRAHLNETYLLAGALFRETDRLEDAIQIADKRKRLVAGDAAQLYNCACEYSLCMGRIGADADTLSEDEKALRETLAKKAIEALQQAVAAGYTDVAHLRKDADLDSIRNLPKFQEIVTGLSGN